MYCSNCGSSLSVRATACPVCKAPVVSIAAAPTKAQKGLCYLFGSILLLCGLLPLIYQGNIASHNQYIDSIYARHSSSYVAALTVNVVNTYLTSLPNLMLSMACCMSILSSVLLFRRSLNVRGVLIFTAITHFLSLLCISGFLDLLDQQPYDVFSYYIGGMDSAACVQLLNQEPQLVDFFRDLAVFRNIVATVTVLSVVVFLFRAQPHQKSIGPNPTRVQHLGIVLMLITLCIISWLSNYNNITLLSFFGDSTFLGYNNATIAFENQISLICTLLLTGIVFFSVLTAKAKRYKTALPAVLILLAAGAAVYLLKNTLCKLEHASAVYFVKTTEFFGRMGIGAAVMLTGCFLWFQAVSKGFAAKGMQITIPILSLVLFVLTEYLVPIVLAAEVFLFWGCTATGLFLSLVSLCIHRNRFSVV